MIRTGMFGNVDGTNNTNKITDTEILMDSKYRTSRHYERPNRIFRLAKIPCDFYDKPLEYTFTTFSFLHDYTKQGTDRETVQSLKQQVIQTR